MRIFYITKGSKNERSIYDIVTGRCDKFNLMNLLGLDQSSFAEHRDEQRLKLLLHRMFAVLARHEWPRWGYKRDLYTAQSKTILAFAHISIFADTL